MWLTISNRHTFFFNGLVYSILFFSLLCGCQPKNLTQLSETQTETNSTPSCEDLNSALRDLAQKNRPEIFSTSVYDNSSYPYLMLEPGQLIIQKDSILFRLKADIDYDRFLDESRNFNVQLFSKTNGQEATNELVDSLLIDKAFYSKNRTPYFLYKFSTKEVDVLGKQLWITLSSEDANCDAKTEIQLTCCTGEAWNEVELKHLISYPALNISPQTYHYAGFTGVLDIQFENNSPAIRDAQFMLERVQNQIDRFRGLDYKIEEISISGYASIKGDAERNKQLSTDRAKSLYEGLIKRNPNVNIQYDGLGEDWKLTQKLIRDSDIYDQSLQQILARNISDDKKEAAISALNLGDQFWEEILAPTRHTVALLKFSYQGQGASLTSYPDSLPLESNALNEAALWQVDVGPYKKGIDIERQLSAITTLLSEKPSGELYALKADYLKAQKDYIGALKAIRLAESLDQNKWQSYKWAIQIDGLAALPKKETASLMQELTTNHSSLVSTETKAIYAAILEEKLGELASANKAWQQIEATRSLNASELNNIAVLYLKLQQLFRAEDYLNAALIKNGELAEAHYNLAVLFAYRGLTDKSVVHIRQVISFRPEWKEEILSNPAFQYVKLDARFESAVEGYER